MYRAAWKSALTVAVGLLLVMPGPHWAQPAAPQSKEDQSKQQTSEAEEPNPVVREIVGLLDGMESYRATVRGEMSTIDGDIAWTDEQRYRAPDPNQPLSMRYFSRVIYTGHFAPRLEGSVKYTIYDGRYLWSHTKVDGLAEATEPDRAGETGEASPDNQAEENAADATPEDSEMQAEPPAQVQVYMTDLELLREAGIEDPGLELLSRLANPFALVEAGTVEVSEDTDETWRLTAEAANDPNGTVDYEIRKSDGTLVRAEFYDPDRELRVIETYESVEVNPELPSDAFAYDVPVGVSVTELTPRLIARHTPPEGEVTINAAQLRTEVETDLQRINEALQRFRQSQDRVPRSLQELASVGNFLARDQALIDRFNPDEKYGYRVLEGGRWMLWSAGRNGENEDGEGDDIVRYGGLR